MIVDVHSHLFPERWRQLGQMPEQMFSVAGLFERQEEAGVDVTVVSDPHIWYGDLDLGSIELTREYNEFVAGVQREHGPRLVGLGSVTPWRGLEHTAEA